MMIYAITFIIVSILIGIYFSKRDKPMSPSSWYKGIAVIILSLFAVSFFDSLDVFIQNFKEGINEDVANDISKN
ncbi:MULTISPECIES: hypothetical protein [Staphylococcus]|uniref:Uncharacterized protein n=3 Tax=Staphylococcus TaxID=1279 RepID=Q49VA3_STAS1|nr:MULTISPECIES: hypothetical protein [Staphylococcus]CRV25684.1 Uncharacterised protein [Streptococcus equi subsp. equi]MBN6756413.1 hypothetical protein [Staphylococcus saprophyticus]MBN6766392.1 hypothetical protein [Staphylococcus saprophyticus]MBN6770708.1 hypothetical protein [Staphylococcus saprophyticus]MBN6780726.1 hypothetical protein [Staphylococcus saprophyticus]